MKQIFIIACLALIAFTCSTTLEASVSNLINYQGRLLDSSGDPVADGSYQLKFIIYDAETDGSALWNSNFQTVQVENGLFEIKLGESPQPALPDDLFGQPDRWLGITVGSDPEIVPRTRFTAVPYAYQTMRADTSSTTLGIEDNVIQLSDIAQNGAGINQIIKWDGTQWIVADDDTGSTNGDITSVMTSGGLGGGGESGDVDVYIADDGVTESKIASGAVTSDKIGASAVQTLHLNDNSVTSQKIADNAVTSGKIQDASIAFSDIGQNGATNGQVMKWSGLAWVASSDDTGSNCGWVDDGSVVHLTTSSDKVGIGTSSPSEKLAVAGDMYVADKVRIGPGQINSGTNSFVAGANSSVTGDWSAVGGGSHHNVEADYSVICGGDSNTIKSSSYAGFIGGGRSNETRLSYSTVCGGWNNLASKDESFVGGGAENISEGDNSVIAGGEQNRAYAEYSVIVGGKNNYIDDEAYEGFIGGGYENALYTTSGWCFIGGGSANSTRENQYSVICGGKENLMWSPHVTGPRYHNAIIGGYKNRIEGDNCVILGGKDNVIASLGVVTYSSMLFGDSVECWYSHRVYFFDGDNYGNVMINKDDADGAAYGPLTIGTTSSNGNGAYLSSGGVWTNASSRELKDNFNLIDGNDLLQRIRQLPMESWQYKGSSERHIWPCSEDFVALFDVGRMADNGVRDDSHLAAGDVAGVALAGVQQLAKENEELRQLVDDLLQRIEQLETANH